MAKMSKDERARLEALLAADDEADDDDRPVKYTHKDGSSLEGSFARVAAFANALGVKLVADKAPDDDESGGDGGQVKRFAGRRIS